jgi:hypothetical protein
MMQIEGSRAVRQDRPRKPSSLTREAGKRAID